MDRSFLSQPEVVAASRRFVCIRPLTYEDRAAQAFLRGLLVGRSGEVENTTCCLLSPDGKDPLTRPARSFQQIYRDAPEMAEWMNRVADEYAAWRRHQKQANRSASSLPVVTGVRLGLATAAADDQPLAVLYNPPGSDRRLESRLAGLAWAPRWIGRLTYAVATEPEELDRIGAVGRKPGIYLVQPDSFGTQGTVVATAPAVAIRSRLEAVLQSGLSLHRTRSLYGFEHQRAGTLQGVFWETALPVTDPMEASARERTRRIQAAQKPR